jgi:hypothetical protein
MKLPSILTALAAFLIPLAALAANPLDGTWRGTFKALDGSGETTLSFVFKVDGERLSGSVEANEGPVPITSGSVHGNAFEFKVALKGNTIDHTGTVSGDTVDMTFRFGSQPPANIKLTRVAISSAADPSGFWRWTVAPPGAGQVFEISASLIYSDGKLTGTYHSRMGDAPISDSSFSGGAIAFSVVRQHDGKQFAVKYKGMFSGDSITGTLELPGYDGGDSATVDWKASRAR